MGKMIGIIQKRILETLETIDERYIEERNREGRWVWMNILVIMVYYPQQLESDKKENWNWNYGKNEHRRIWESCKGLKRRGLIEERVVNAKALGLKVRFGGTIRWLEIRKV